MNENLQMWSDSKKVLDVACGCGYGSALLAERHPDKQVTGVDIDPAAIAYARQHYQLVSWRDADRSLNYRRFFTVNSLAGIRVEDPEWFDASHAEIRRWFDEGLVDGLSEEEVFRERDERERRKALPLRLEMPLRRHQ